jgi:hypothetical protein
VRFVGNAVPFGGSLWGGLPVTQRPVLQGRPSAPPARRLAQAPPSPEVTAAAEAVRQAEEDEAGIARNYNGLVFALGEDAAALALAEARASVVVAREIYAEVVENR